MAYTYSQLVEALVRAEVLDLEFARKPSPHLERVQELRDRAVQLDGSQREMAFLTLALLLYRPPKKDTLQWIRTVAPSRASAASAAEGALVPNRTTSPLVSVIEWLMRSTRG